MSLGRMPTKVSALVLAGGTGGHVYPALAVAEALRGLGWQVQWLGSRGGMEERVVPEAGFTFHGLRLRGLRGRGVFSLLFGVTLMLLALVHSGVLILRLRPSLVLGMGGFVAGPAGFAAWLLRRRLVIHEQNAVAGATNRLLAPLAWIVLAAFPGCFGSIKAGRVRVTGNPLRREIVSLKPVGRRQHPLRVLVLGGSQGAEALNERIPEVIRRLENIHGAGAVTVLHQAGRAHRAATQARYADVSGVEVRDFVDDMVNAYRRTDLAICRSGAITVAELAVVGIASILIPYPYAVDDHQTSNARHLSDYGAAFLVPQHEADIQTLAGLVERFIAEPDLSHTMGQAARARSVPDATERVIACCQEAVRG